MRWKAGGDRYVENQRAVRMCDEDRASNWESLVGAGNWESSGGGKEESARL